MRFFKCPFKIFSLIDISCQKRFSGFRVFVILNESEIRTKGFKWNFSLQEQGAFYKKNCVLVRVNSFKIYLMIVLDE